VDTIEANKRQLYNFLARAEMSLVSAGSARRRRSLGTAFKRDTNDIRIRPLWI